MTHAPVFPGCDFSELAKLLEKIRRGALSAKELIRLGVTASSPIPFPIPGPVIVPGLALGELTTQGVSVANPNIDPGTGQTSNNFNGNCSGYWGVGNVSSGVILVPDVPAGQTFTISSASLSSLTWTGATGIVHLYDTFGGNTNISTLSASGTFSGTPYVLAAGHNVKIIVNNASINDGRFVSFSWALSGFYQTAAGAPGNPPSFGQIFGDDLG